MKIQLTLATNNGELSLQQVFVLSPIRTGMRALWWREKRDEALEWEAHQGRSHFNFLVLAYSQSNRSIVLFNWPQEASKPVVHFGYGILEQAVQKQDWESYPKKWSLPLYTRKQRDGLIPTFCSSSGNFPPFSKFHLPFNSSSNLFWENYLCLLCSFVSIQLIGPTTMICHFTLALENSLTVP